MNLFPCLAALTVPTAGPLSGQEPIALTRGRTVEATLAPGDTHGHTVTLGSRQFVCGEADQRTVDVAVNG